MSLFLLLLLLLVLLLERSMCRKSVRTSHRLRIVSAVLSSHPRDVSDATKIVVLHRRRVRCGARSVEIDRAACGSRKTMRSYSGNLTWRNVTRNWRGKGTVMQRRSWNWDGSRTGHSISDLGRVIVSKSRPGSNSVQVYAVYS